MLRLWNLVSIAMWLLFSASAEAAERLAVLELSSDADISAGQLAALTDTVRSGVKRQLGDRVQVMTRENMEVMLTDMGLDANCVAEGACEVETARNLGVDYVVTGTVTAFGDSLVASLKLHETKSGELRGSEQTVADDALALLSDLPELAGKVVQVIEDRGSPAVPVVSGPASEPGTTAPADAGTIGLIATGELQSATVGKLVCIGPGQFDKGEGRENRIVELTRGFCVMEHEVTRAAWAAMQMGHDGKFASCGNECPIDKVSWNEAVEYANQLSAAEGLEPAYTGEGKTWSWNRDAAGYRLLTSDEWEAAARGRESFAYSGSDAPFDVAWIQENSRRTPHPACEKQRNGYGLCDMSGNIQEWVWDRYGNGNMRLARGGSWQSMKVNGNARVTYAYRNTAGYRSSTIGFRLARNQ